MTETASTGSTSTQTGSSGQPAPSNSKDSGLNSQQKAIAEVKGTRAVPNSAAASQVKDTRQERTDDESTEEPVDEYAELAKKKYRLKVDGKEKELTVDELARDYSLKAASMKRFEEAAAKEKQVESFFESLLKDPKSVLSNQKFKERGFNLRSFAEGILKEEIQREMLSPEELERMGEKSELEQLRADKEELKKEKEKQDYENHKIAAEKKYSAKLQEALQSARLPKTPFVLKRMAEFQKQAIRDKYELSPTELGDLVREEITGDVSHLIKEVDAETLIAMFGEETAKKIREYDLKKVQQPVAPPTQSQRFGVKKTSSRSEKLSIRDFSEQMRKQYGV